MKLRAVLTKRSFESKNNAWAYEGALASRVAHYHPDDERPDLYLLIDFAIAQDKAVWRDGFGGWGSPDSAALYAYPAARLKGRWQGAVAAAQASAAIHGLEAFLAPREFEDRHYAMAALAAAAVHGFEAEMAALVEEYFQEGMESD